MGADTEETMQAIARRYVHRRLMSGQIEARTAEQLRSRLRDFAANAPADPRRVTRRHVEAWMERPDLSAQYRRARLSALRGFTRWCVSEGVMVVKDPCLMVPLPKVPVQLPKRLTHAEAQQLVAAVSRDRRTRLIVLLMLQLGLRRVEVARANVEDVDVAGRSMTVRGKGGGGVETAVLPIDDETWGALTSYLAEAGHTHGPLIRNRVRVHGRCAPATISELVRQGMVDAGIKKPGDATRTPHSCRHTTAHDVLEMTDNVHAVQLALRHASISTSMKYLRGSTRELRPIMAGRRYSA